MYHGISPQKHVYSAILLCTIYMSSILSLVTEDPFAVLPGRWIFDLVFWNITIWKNQSPFLSELPFIDSNYSFGKNIFMVIWLLPKYIWLIIKIILIYSPVLNGPLLNY